MEQSWECSILFPSSVRLSNFHKRCQASLLQKLKLTNLPFSSFLQTNHVHSLNGKLSIVFVRIKGRRDWPGPLPKMDFYPTSKFCIPKSSNFSRLHFPRLSSPHPLVSRSSSPASPPLSICGESSSSLPCPFGPLCAYPL